VRRRNTPNASTGRGLGDVLGILLISASILLLAALFSYDPGDVPPSGTDVHSEAHNWIGRAGAWTAYGLFFILGGGSFLLPILLFLFGLSYLFQLMAYFHRRWVWAVVLMVVCMAWLDLYGDTAFLRQLHQNINGPAGGWVGMVLNDYLFDYFGTLGASILFLTLYLISLLYLTNFELGTWLRAWWERRRAALDPASLTEAQLERRARELKRQARQLERRLNREQPKADPVEEASAGLGADLQPVPEPQVRDLSVPAERSDEGTDPEPDLSPAPEEQAEEPGETEAPAAAQEEIEEAEDLEEEQIMGPATTEAVLGRDAEPEEESEEETPSKPEPGPEPPPPPPPPSRPAPRPKPPPRKPRPIVVAAAPKIGNYQLPPMALLNLPEPAVRQADSKDELMANARLMQTTLGQFGIEVQLGDITRGPTITRYELHPAPGVKLERITGLSNNIAAALKAERIHILAPVPGKSSVGVEVPNPVKTKVIMRDLLEAPEWKATRYRVPLALGKDVYGHPIIADLSEMPHLLIAGSTGSGKSVCINSIITSLLYRFPPDQLRFVMIDPKVVELQQYNSLPHLVVPVVTDPKKVVLALRWVVNEMEKRYQIFARVGVRNIKSFNDRPKNKPLPQQQPELPLRARREKIEAGTDGFAVEVDEEIVIPRDDDIVVPEKLSYIVVIIDELADLMLVAPADVEMAIARITQMARAAGIHVIVATQRPSVDVITGVIKANIPARIAFQVASKVDSRTILDAMGADKLLGKGDMLYLPPGSAKLIRAQGALITDQEINALVEFISKQGKPSYEAEIHQQLSRPGSHYEADGGSNQDEDLIEQCIEIIRSEQKASVSLLQRRLRLGYTRAARIMDELEDRGIVGPGKGAEPRDILIDLDGTGADGGGQHGV